MDASEPAMRGLTNLGFTKHESQRALDIIATQHGGSRRGLPLDSLIREALRVLT